MTISPAAHPAAPAVAALLDAAGTLNEIALRSILRSHSDEHGVDDTVVDVVLPFLREIGLAWERGTHTVAHEHFASQIVRGWLMGEALSGGSDPAPHAGPSPVVLACPPGERHDLGLLCFHVLITRAGVPSRFLGSDTPLPGLGDVCRVVAASGVVVAATRRRSFEAHGGALRMLARHYPLTIGGAGADAEIAGRVGATGLSTDMRRSVSEFVDWHARITAAA
ncbi:B12-binding domain-containing protein [Knoellia locipacati]|uniref:cobalamin B12-binding domain-containing protein n=1 Tax=Knoellia locipacati TaxID=882824 RepID=UPI00384D72D6